MLMATGLLEWFDGLGFELEVEGASFVGVDDLLRLKEFSLSESEESSSDGPVSSASLLVSSFLSTSWLLLLLLLLKSRSLVREGIVSSN